MGHYPVRLLIDSRSRLKGAVVSRCQRFTKNFRNRFMYGLPPEKWSSLMYGFFARWRTE
jgi:hypothetical protein